MAESKGNKEPKRRSPKLYVVKYRDQQGKTGSTEVEAQSPRAAVEKVLADPSIEKTLDVKRKDADFSGIVDLLVEELIGWPFSLVGILVHIPLAIVAIWWFKEAFLLILVAVVVIDVVLCLIGMYLHGRFGEELDDA